MLKTVRTLSFCLLVVFAAVLLRSAAPEAKSPNSSRNSLRNVGPTQLDPNIPGQSAATEMLTPAQTPGSAICPTFTVPAVTHGFQTTGGLPNGDLFLLPTPLTFTVSSASAGGGLPTGFSTFVPSAANFGGTLPQLGGLAGLNTTGFSFSTPGGSVTVLSCAESFWDIPFVLATSGAVSGDRITMFMQTPGGTATAIAVFTIEAGGARVSSLHSFVQLFNNRLATGSAISTGALLPLNQSAGQAGQRTIPLTLAFSMAPDSPLMGCLFFGTTITRGLGAGTSSVLFTDIVVTRKTASGDVGRAGTGLLNGLTGGFPTGQSCTALCAGCLPLLQVTCPTFTVPAVTHGFQTTGGLPNGDLFALPTPLTFTVSSANASIGGILPTGFSTFVPSAASFGGALPQLGGLAGLNTTGFSFSTPGGNVTVLSCLDSFWDIPFVIATSGVAAGDRVTMFLQPPGEAPIVIAVFTVEIGGGAVRVTTLNPFVHLFNNRLATGSAITVGTVFPLNQSAGQAGQRTIPLTLAISMAADSPLMGCAFFGTTIAREWHTGTTSVLFTDIIVTRKTASGDDGRAGAGLLNGLTGGFPTGQPCPVFCPGCPSSCP
jgi:hypothetical protein